MDKREKSGGTPDPRLAYLPLAQWLQTLLTIPSPLRPDTVSPLDDVGKGAQSYHLPYFQQLPNFAQALLKEDSLGEEQILAATGLKATAAATSS